jgi:hypothetical protein
MEKFEQKCFLKGFRHIPPGTNPAREYEVEELQHWPLE